MHMFPNAGIRRSDIDEYNKQTWAEIEYIRDFIVLHYHVTQRQDSPFWRARRGMDIPQACVEQYCKAPPVPSSVG